jgi:hypothetical protein
MSYGGNYSSDIERNHSSNGQGGEDDKQDTKQQDDNRKLGPQAEAITGVVLQ